MKRKLGLILILIVIITLSITTQAYCYLGNVMSGGDGFLTGAIDEASGTEQSELVNVVTGLAEAGLAIGVVVAVIAGIVIAIKFMSQGAMGKAEMKQALTPYLIGVVALFACYAIWVIVIEILDAI